MDRNVRFMFAEWNRQGIHVYLLQYEMDPEVSSYWKWGILKDYKQYEGVGSNQ